MMAFVSPPAMRSTIEERDGQLIVTMPVRRNWFVFLFLSFWMCGWVIGECVGILGVLGFLPKSNGPAEPAFLVLWLVAWTVGGLVAGSMLRSRGHDVKIYEQAAEVQRLGAGINLGPNLMKVMRHVGVEQKLIDIGLEPVAWTSRDYKSGDTLFRYPFQEASRKAFGATYLLIHRGDFHAVLKAKFGLNDR